jgi:outer membrane protein assembly factor BamB
MIFRFSALLLGTILLLHPRSEASADGSRKLKGNPGAGGAGGGGPGPRNEPSRHRWKIQISDTSGSYSLSIPEVGPDGTIYAVEIYNNVIAANPDGTTKWTALNTGDKGIAYGNGKVYSAKDGSIVYAHDATDGTLVWTYGPDPGTLLGVMLDVAVGPDNDIYAVAAGPGVFSLRDLGNEPQLKWQQPEEYLKHTPSTSEARFGQTKDSDGSYQLYYDNSYQRALRLDTGDEVFKTTCCVAVGSNAVPDVNSNEFWSIRTSFGTTATRLLADGTTEVCSFSFPTFAGALEPVAGPSGTAYTISQGNMVYSIGSNCQSNYAKTLSANVALGGISPNESVLVVFAGPTSSLPASVIGINAGNGKELWRTELPLDNGSSHFFDTQVAFSSDGITAYFVTHLQGFGSWLHAIDIS